MFHCSMKFRLWWIELKGIVVCVAMKHFHFLRLLKLLLWSEDGFHNWSLKVFIYCMRSCGETFTCLCTARYNVGLVNGHEVAVNKLSVITLLSQNWLNCWMKMLKHPLAVVCTLYLTFQVIIYMCSASQLKSMHFEPNVNIGLRGSSRQRRQKYRDGALIYYIRWFVTLYSVSTFRSVSLWKGISFQMAEWQEKFLSILKHFSPFFSKQLRLISQT